MMTAKYKEKAITEITKVKEEINKNASELNKLKPFANRVKDAELLKYLTSTHQNLPNDMCDKYSFGDLQAMNTVNAAYKVLYPNRLRVSSFPESLYDITKEPSRGHWHRALTNMQSNSSIMNMKEEEKEALKVLLATDYDGKLGTNTTKVIQNTNFSHVQELINIYNKKGDLCSSTLKTHLEQTNLDRLKACVEACVATDKDQAFQVMVIPNGHEDFLPFYVWGRLTTLNSKHLHLQFLEQQITLPLDNTNKPNLDNITEDLFINLPRRPMHANPNLAWILRDMKDYA